MRRKDPQEAERLFEALERFESDAGVLPGIRSVVKRETFVDRIIESRRKMEVFGRMTITDISEARSDPTSGLFDPYKAALLAQQRGDIEEALWLIFLAVHFGRHSHSKWQYAADFYGKLGEGTWSWSAACSDVSAVRDWLADNSPKFKRPGQRSGFGNHRKYESLNGLGPNGTGAAIESYVSWIQGFGSHRVMLAEAIDQSPADSRSQFEYLYRSMRRSVHRFGRIGCFDYLATIAKLDLAPIEAGQAYLANSSGPIRGARLLFGGGSVGAIELERQLAVLETYLQVGFDPLEDALCNWQKNPAKFTAFRG